MNISGNSYINDYCNILGIAGSQHDDPVVLMNIYEDEINTLFKAKNKKDDK